MNRQLAMEAQHRCTKYSTKLHMLYLKKESKKEIRKKLEFLGISEATLFADNIDIVCKNIVEQCKKIGFQN